jgi:phosphate transport system substrate-binding protein
MDKRCFLKFLSGVILVPLLGACSNKGPDPYTDDVPTKGHVVLLADEGIRPLMERQEEVFESIYAKADVDIRYLPAAELLKAMMDDTVRCTFASLLPGGEQEAWLRSRQRVARPVPICTDAIALVAHKDRHLKAVSVPQLRAMLRAGNAWPTWAVIDGSSTERVALVFDGVGSGVMRSLADSLFPGEAVSLNGLTAPGAEAVVARVAGDPNSIGLLPFSAFSDLDTPAMRRMRDQVDLIPVSAGADLATALLPTQGSLADGRYPLRRTLYAILTEPKTGLGTGFVSFVAGHKGQRIILKQGLAPEHVPARDVEIVNE